MQQLSGGCQCGAIRLAATGTPKRVGVCHCLECRKHHGAVFYAAAIFDQTDVTIKGAPSNYKGRHFCSNCGSSVFAQSEDEIEIHLGTLDDPNALTPTYESWVIRREDWLPPIAGATQHDRDRSND